MASRFRCNFRDLLLLLLAADHLLQVYQWIIHFKQKLMFICLYEQKNKQFPFCRTINIYAQIIIIITFPFCNFLYAKPHFKYNCIYFQVGIANKLVNLNPQEIIGNQTHIIIEPKKMKQLYSYIFNVYTYSMISPTFASFKPVKQPNHHPIALGQINMNIQPKTFHELKSSANIIKPENGFGGLRQQQQPIPEKITFNIVNQSRRNPIGYNLKKTHSEVNFLQDHENQSRPTQSIKSKPKINTKNCLTAKKNYVNVERTSKDKCISRPSIMGPSLLKNKSFIYTYRHQGKQNTTGRPSHDVFKAPFMFSQQTSIDSIDRRSQDISISVGSSGGDSFFNSSKFEDSLTLKDSRSSNSKLDTTLNFGRKRDNNKQENKVKYSQDSTIVSQPTSSLSLMAKEMHSSFEDENNNNEPIVKRSFENASINFSKKFQQYRKPKQNIEPKLVTTIDQFELMEQIGQGKYGKVYMAKHKATGFICALKTISKQKIKQENIEQPLIRQIKIQMYLNHPNIVKLYGFFHDKQNLYLIMQCCLSGHLLKMIKQRKIFQENQILEIISNVFQAVSFLHCHGIIHRDLKPENIVIQNGVYKICDFGWAAYAKGDTRTTFCGTPLYVCPEVLKGNEYDAKADVWGLGVLTYELAYGRVPFPIWSQSDMIKIVKDPVYFPSWTSVSERMQNLIKSMLNKDPNKRLSLNQILASPLIVQYVGARFGVRSQIQALF